MVTLTVTDSDSANSGDKLSDSSSFEVTVHALEEEEEVAE